MVCATIRQQQPNGTSSGGEGHPTRCVIDLCWPSFSTHIDSSNNNINNNLHQLGGSRLNFIHRTHTEAPMSKKRAPARSGGVSPATFSSPATTKSFASSTISVLSFIGEPSDLSPISDSSVVVLFKGLSKKEEITKTKALEGLLAAVESVESTEDAVLAAWVSLATCLPHSDQNANIHYNPP